MAPLRTVLIGGPAHGERVTVPGGVNTLIYPVPRPRPGQDLPQDLTHEYRAAKAVLFGEPFIMYIADGTSVAEGTRLAAKMILAWWRHGGR